MVRYIFTIPGITFFLSNKVCQDSLENFFGQQRQRGRVHENPSVMEFMKNTQALRVVNGTCRNVRGNCRGGNSQEKLLSCAPLAKRRYRGPSASQIHLLATSSHTTPPPSTLSQSSSPSINSHPPTQSLVSVTSPFPRTSHPLVSVPRPAPSLRTSHPLVSVSRPAPSQEASLPHT